MEKRIIFTKATPKAAQGIRALYEAIGAKVYAEVDQETGLVNVSVDIPEGALAKAEALAA